MNFIYVWIYENRRCQFQHNEPGTFPGNTKDFQSIYQAQACLSVKSLLSHLACVWLAGYPFLSLYSRVREGVSCKENDQFCSQKKPHSVTHSTLLG